MAQGPAKAAGDGAGVFEGVIWGRGTDDTGEQCFKGVLAGYIGENLTRGALSGWEMDSGEENRWDYWEGRRGRYMYYSLCVGTTMSFGANAPNSGAARLIAAIEIILCIVLVGLIVGLLLGRVQKK